ncbi:MAG: virulence factor [SAR324 cluster bacterium]|nr:virulence factor [SAR324 cluster bacterium]
MPQLIKISWRDIPSQVIAKNGRNKAKVQLSTRFQKAIDRAAMKAGRQGSDEYLDDWQRSYKKCEGELTELAHAAAEQLELDYPDERLEALVRSRGLEEIPS